MNGNKFFLDTNAIIALLKGNSFIEDILSKAEWIGISCISIIEFLAFPNLDPDDKILFQTLIKRVEVIGISNDILWLEKLANQKIETKLKLPDVIIAGYSIHLQDTLISNDKELKRIPNLSQLNF